MRSRILIAAVVATVLVGVLAVVVPIPALADAPQQGKGKCFVDGENPCGPCEEWKRNCRHSFCKPIRGCVPDTLGEPLPQT